MSGVREECVRRLESFRSRAEQIAKASPPSSAKDSVGTELIAGGVGEVAAEFVSSVGLEDLVPRRTARSAARKMVRSSAKEQARAARAAWLESQNRKVDQLVDQIEDFLGTLSIPSPSLTPDGNSYRLHGKMGRVHRLKKPDSKARALVSVLGEIRSLRPIPNAAIPTYLAKRSVKTQEEATQLVTSLERALRKCVRELLGRESPNWWTERVPAKVRKRAEKRQEREEAIYPSVSAPEDPLSYVGFADYDDIVLVDRNWDDSFKQVFENEAWLSTKLQELEPIRNALMHSRKLTLHGLEKLRVNSRDLLERIRRS